MKEADVQAKITVSVCKITNWQKCHYLKLHDKMIWMETASLILGCNWK